MPATAILLPSAIRPGGPAGGKAEALADLIRAGFRVPPFFVAPEGSGEESLLAAFDEQFAADARVACRSSARGEDSSEHSFAGQYSSFLDVGRSDLVSRVAEVWASGDSERAATYGSERNAEVLAPAAIVQEMVDAAFAGVAFSADPVTGNRDITVVSAVRGWGESLVSGEVDGETVVIESEGTIRDRKGDVSVGLPDDLACDVADLARRAETHFGSPQDIEWATGRDGTLHLLQSRPITTLPPAPVADVTPLIWDNSNIAESYSGVTTPLTYSFARRAYENVYREFCRLLGVPKDRIEQGDPVFRAMIGLIRGRIYYNLVSWYRVLAMLPGFRVNRSFMEQMMGVREPMPDAVVAEIERESRVGPVRDGWHLACTLLGLVRHAFGLPSAIRGFHERLATALDGAPADLEDLSAEELGAHYRDLEAQLLRRWDAPLVNDFFAMIACGVLRKLAANWLGDESLANTGLRDIGDIISLEPARRIRTMAEQHARGESIEEGLADYVTLFGDRCVEELKLESTTLADDLSPLRHSIEALAERIRSESKGPRESPGEEGGNDLEEAIDRLGPVRRLVFRRVLSLARARVRDRENLRFERTRLFGRVRRIMRGLGTHLVAMNRLDARDDVFYCELEELLGTFDGTAACPVSPPLVVARRSEFERYRAEPAPPDRFETRGSPAAPGAIVATSDAGASNTGDFAGIGACAGVVRGPVRVVRDPRGVELAPGEILVAQQTDPGWVVLFPAASGLLVERGSLLSHSAIVAREMGIPAIVSLPSITTALTDGEWVEMDGAAGTVRRLSDPSQPASPPPAP